MAEEFSAFSHEVSSAPQKVSRGSHSGGIDVSQRKHAAPKHGCNLVRIDPVVFGFTSVNGFHVQGVPKDKGDAKHSAQVGYPVPGKDAFDGDDDVFHVGFNDVEENISLSFDVFV
jgi:hypothetical protein